MRTVHKALLIGALAALALSFSEQSRAADIKQQTWRQKAKPVESQAQLPGASIRAMDCKLCTSASIVARREIVPGKPNRGTKLVTRSVHECPTCLNTFARRTGTKEIAGTHTCRADNESPNCCDTSSANGRGA